ncbi:MAG: hypothetical protein ACYS6W_17785 [Planctomycetota bacterium]|jgi:hypothetical protein
MPTLEQAYKKFKNPPTLREARTLDDAVSALRAEPNTFFAPTIPDPQGLPSEGLEPFVAPLGQKNERARPLWDEFVDATARGVARTGSAGAQAAKMFWEYEPPQARWPYVPQTKAMKKTEAEQAQKWEERAGFLWEVSKNPGLAAQNEDLASKALGLIGETIPYISATTGAYMFAGPAGGFAVGSLVEGNSAYRTALDSGVPEDKAEQIGVGVGMVSGAIEAFGGKYAEDLILKATSKLKSKILRGGAVFGVGTVVGGQEIAQITGEETYRDVDWGEAVNRTLGSMAGGAFLGGVMKGGAVVGRQAMFAPPKPKAPAMSPAQQGVVDRFNRDVEDIQEQYGVGREAREKLIQRKKEADQEYEAAEAKDMAMFELEVEKETKPTTKKPAAKQPWEMTKEEFGTEQPSKDKQWLTHDKPIIKIDSELVLPTKAGILGKDKGKIAKVELVRNLAHKEGIVVEARIGDETYTLSSGEAHRGIIQQALSEGKPVPAEVLAEYPDLKPAAEGEVKKAFHGTPQRREK